MQIFYVKTKPVRYTNELEKSLKKKGINILTSTEVEKAEINSSNTVDVTLKTSNGEKNIINTEIVLSAVGIKTNIENIGLEDLGINKDSGEQKSLLDCIAGNGDNDPQTSLRLNELKKIIAKAIDTLPEKERLMISLYYYEELTIKEIG